MNYILEFLSKRNCLVLKTVNKCRVGRGRSYLYIHLQHDTSSVISVWWL